MVLANVREQTGDVPPDVCVRGLDARNNLYKGEQDREMATWAIYLGYHFKPCVYFDCAEPAGNRMADFILGTEFEPKSQQSESIL